MALQAQTREIDGLTFTVYQLPAMRSMRLIARLGRLFGPAIASGAAGFKGSGAKGFRDLANIDVGLVGEALGGALESLFVRLTEQEMEEVIRALLQTTQIHPTSEEQAARPSAPLAPRDLLPSFDLAMQGRPGTVFKLLQFAFEVNYGNFFGRLAEFARASGASPAGSESPSPST